MKNFGGGGGDGVKIPKGACCYSSKSNFSRLSQLEKNWPKINTLIGKQEKPIKSYDKMH